MHKKYIKWIGSKINERNIHIYIQQWTAVLQKLNWKSTINTQKMLMEFTKNGLNMHEIAYKMLRKSPKKRTERVMGSKVGSSWRYRTIWFLNYWLSSFGIYWTTLYCTTLSITHKKNVTYFMLCLMSIWLVFIILEGTARPLCRQPWLLKKQHPKN